MEEGQKERCVGMYERCDDGVAEVWCGCVNIDINNKNSRISFPRLVELRRKTYMGILLGRAQTCLGRVQGRRG